jgi:hypothetical protein
MNKVHKPSNFNYRFTYFNLVRLEIQGFFLFTTASRPALGPTHPPTLWVPRVLSPRAKWPGREANHSPPTRAEIKNAWNYTPTPPYFLMAWCLVKHRRFRIFTAMKIQVAVFYFMTPCTDVVGHQSFGGSLYCHNPEDYAMNILIFRVLDKAWKLPSSVEVQNACSYTCTPPQSSRLDVSLSAR